MAVPHRSKQPDARDNLQYSSLALKYPSLQPRIIHLETFAMTTPCYDRPHVFRTAAGACARYVLNTRTEIRLLVRPNPDLKDLGP